MPRYRRNYDFDIDWKAYHEEERHRITEKYGGADVEIRKLFFDLDTVVLDSIFREYKTTYGGSKADYARKQYSSWKSGKVLMSGEIAERLLDILPRFLSFDQRYDLFKQLFLGSSVQRTRIEVDATQNLRTVTDRILAVVEQLEPPEISEEVRAGLKWLCDSDIHAAEPLIRQVLFEERKLRINAIPPYLCQLSSLLKETRETKANVSSTLNITLPGASVTIVVSSKPPQSPLTEGSSMTAGSKDSDDQKTSNLPQRIDQSTELTEIRSAEQLLSEAVKHISPEKRQGLVEKAAEEAVRLQVKRVDYEVESEAQERMIETARSVQRDNAANPGNEVVFEQEIGLTHDWWAL